MYCSKCGAEQPIKVTEIEELMDEIGATYEASEKEQVELAKEKYDELLKDCENAKAEALKEGVSNAKAEAKEIIDSAREQAKTIVEKANKNAKEKEQELQDIYKKQLEAMQNNVKDINNGDESK